MPYNYIFIFLLGVLPSTIWLAFYLAKDIHPEPKKWLLMIFLAGAAIAPLATGIEWQLIGFFNSLGSAFPVFFNIFPKDLAVIFIAIAAIEETGKYLAVRLTMKGNPVFDEPADAMIYMIVAALGFAAIENIIVIHSYAPSIFTDPAQPLAILAFRFIGATFLHTLASGIIGFYYALSLSKTNRQFPVIKGIFFAILLHGLFNYSITILEISSIIYLSIPLFIVLIFVSKDFRILQGISPKSFDGQS